MARQQGEHQRLLGQTFPKDTDLFVRDEAHLDVIADQLNARPRKTLDWRSPAEVYTETVAMTT